MAAADQRVVASAVLSQVNSEDLRIIFRLFSDDAQQIVRRAVVDGNDLISKIRPFRDDLTNFIYDESYGPFAVRSYGSCQYSLMTPVLMQNRKELHRSPCRGLRR